MKYIICGIEHIGLKVVKKLIEYKEDVTVITLNSNESLLQEIKDSVNLHIEGNARHKKVLEMSGIYDADVLMILTSNDLNNIEIHLTAREMNKNIKIITSLHNEEGLSKEIEEGFAITKAINIPSYSAPSFVSTCLDDSIIHVFNHKTTTNFVGQRKLDENSILVQKTISEIENTYNIKIIRLQKNNQTHSTTLNDYVLVPGDHITFFTNNKRLLSLVENKNQKQKSNPFSEKKKDLYGKIGKMIRNTPSNVKLIILLYSILIIFSTLFYFLNMKLSWIDAFYFVITTTTTVGFGDINLLNERPLLKLYGAFMMISGAALLAAFFSIIADSLIRKRFEQFLGSSKFNLRNHVIIAGMGSIGYRVANMLHENGVKVVVIEKDYESSYIHMLRDKIPVVYGDAQFSSVLLKAGIKKAQTVAALINDDMKNMNIVLQARKLNESVRTTTRIFNQKIEAVMENLFEVGNVCSTSSFTMPLFLACAIQKNTITAFQMDGDIYLLFETDTNETPQLKEMSEELLLHDYGIMVMDTSNNKNPFNSFNGTEHFGENEKIIVFGSYLNIRGLMEL